MMLAQFVIPIRTVSESNCHEHWRHRQRRAKAQRSAAFLSTRGHGGISLAKHLPLIVTITRVSPRALDDDNLAMSQKHVRDGIADALGVNDRDPLVRWMYQQRRGAKGQYAVDVSIMRADAVAS